MKPLTRRRFVQGSAGAAGLLTVGSGLRYLKDASEAEAGQLTGKSVVYRTGHSNNCDGACGHLVTVVDGKVRLVQGAPWGERRSPASGPRTSTRARVCAAPPRSRTPTAPIGSATHINGSASAAPDAGGGSAGTTRPV